MTRTNTGDLLRALAVAGALLVLGAGAGCGGDGDTSRDGQSTATTAQPDNQDRRLFVEACGSCHTFTAAGSKGSVGPPLDDIELDAAAISKQIDAGAGAMPPDLLAGAQRERVARWIADNAGS
ncbi:MAG: c-type cytochrome [Gaiellaceae bacterium]